MEHQQRFINTAQSTSRNLMVPLKSIANYWPRPHSIRWLGTGFSICDRGARATESGYTVKLIITINTVVSSKGSVSQTVSSPLPLYDLLPCIKIRDLRLESRIELTSVESHQIMSVKTK